MLHYYLGCQPDPRSSARGGILVAVWAAHRPCPRAANGPRLGFGRVIVACAISNTDRRWKNIERDGLAAAVGALAGAVLGDARPRPLTHWAPFGTFGALGALGPVIAIGSLGALGPVVALRAIVSIRPFAALRAIVAILTFRALLALGALGPIVKTVVAVVRVHVGIVAVAVVLHVIAALAPLFVEARLALPQHAEIMIRELKIIFGLDTVPSKLGIARHALVFLKQLGGITALTIILPVARLSAGIGTPWLAPAAATASALTIVDQICKSLTSRQCPHRRTVPFRLRLRANSAQESADCVGGWDGMLVKMVGSGPGPA